MSQDVSKSIRMITQKAHGTYNGAIIDMMDEVSNVLLRFNHRLTKLENTQCCSTDLVEPTGEASEKVAQTEKTQKSDVLVPLPDMQEEVPDMFTGDPVLESELSKPTPGAPRKANKGTTGKAKKTPKRSI